MNFELEKEVVNIHVSLIANVNHDCLLVMVPSSEVSPRNETFMKYCQPVQPPVVGWNTTFFCDFPGVMSSTVIMEIMWHCHDQGFVASMDFVGQ